MKRNGGAFVVFQRVSAFRYLGGTATCRGSPTECRKPFTELTMTIHRRVCPTFRRAAAAFAAGSIAAGLSACSETTAPTGESLSVCHVSGATGSLMDIRASELSEHRSHGDYVASIVVRKANPLNGDGIHFARITDAIASARASRVFRGETSTALCRITIAVAPGVFTGSVNDSVNTSLEALPLTIDVPDITLQGSYVMPLDAKGRATAVPGASGGSSATTLLASPGLVSIRTGNALDKYAEPLIVVNSHPNGPRGDGAIIEGFILQSGNDAAGATVGGNAVWAMRAKGLVVRGNQIEGGFSEPVEMRASVGRIERNVLTGRGGSCALCIFGPGDYQVTANRQVGLTGRLGVLVFPTIFTAVPPNVEQLVLPATALVTATVTNNELRDHQEVPFGIGVRVAAIGPGAPDVVGSARVVVQDNDLSSNRFAVVAEAGFLVANTAQRGSIDLTLKGNVLTSSCQAGLLVAFNSQANAVGSQAGLSTRNSSYAVTLGDDIAWGSVWYSHPAGAGNSLMVDGKPIENGLRAAYDPKGC